MLIVAIFLGNSEKMAAATATTSIWILDYIGDPDDDAMVDASATVTLQVCLSHSEATARVRQLIAHDRAEKQAIEAEGCDDDEEDDDDDAGAAGDNDEDGKVVDDGADDGDGDDDDDAFFDPPYEAVEEYGAYRITQVSVGSFYGWHDLDFDFTAAACV